MSKMNKKIKTMLCLIPTVVGLVVCFNELEKLENEENALQSKVYAYNEPQEPKVEKEEVKEPEIVEVDIEDKEVMVIAKSGLNVREDASTEADITEKLSYTKMVTITNEKDGWYKIEEGYVHGDYVMDKQEALNAGAVTEMDIELYKRLDPSYVREEPLNVGVTGKSNITINDMYKLTENVPGLKGIESAVIEAEHEYGVNAFMTIAVARLESGNGTSPISQDKNNLFGMNAQDHDPYNLAFTYSGKGESIKDFADRLSKNYIDQGLDTLSKIQPKYCPTSDAWDDKVNTLMAKTLEIVK